MKASITLSLVVAGAAIAGIVSWMEASARRRATRPASPPRLVRTSSVLPPTEPSSPAPMTAPAEEPRPAPVPEAIPAPPSEEPKPPPAEPLDPLIARAEDLEAHGDLKGAIDAYREVLKRTHESVTRAARACYRMALCIERLGNPKAIKAGKRILLQLAWCLDDQADLKLRAIHDLAIGMLGCEYAPRPVSADAQSQRLREELVRSQGNADFRQASLEDILGSIRESCKLSLEIDAWVRESGTSNQKLDLDARGRPMEDVFASLCDATGLAWRIDGAVVLFYSKQAELEQTLASEANLPDFEEDDPVQAARNQAALDRLATYNIDFGLTDCPLPDVARELGSKTLTAVVIDRNTIAHPDEMKLTFHVDSLPAHQAFDLICKMFDLGWYADHGVIHLTSREDADTRRHVRTK